MPEGAPFIGRVVKLDPERRLHIGDGARQLNGSLGGALGNDVKPVLLSDCANSRQIGGVRPVSPDQLLAAEGAMVRGDSRRLCLPSHRDQCGDAQVWIDGLSNARAVQRRPIAARKFDTLAGHRFLPD
jgi:hypothetical protein